MAGRRPKPTSLKLVTGNPGKRALPEEGAEPVPPVADIVMPDYLKSKRERRFWDYYLPKLTSMGTLTSVDVDLFGEWCQLSAMMAQKKISATERTRRHAIGGELGIGAASRAKLGTRKKPKVDPADEFFDEPKAS